MAEKQEPYGSEATAEPAIRFDVTDRGEVVMIRRTERTVLGGREEVTEIAEAMCLFLAKIDHGECVAP